MELQRALDVLARLADGQDPVAAQAVSAATWQQPEVAEALAVAVQVVQRQALRAARRGQLPPNVGKPWTPDDDAALLAAFDAGTAPAQLAGRFGRTRTGIRARLERYGRLQPAPPGAG